MNSLGQLVPLIRYVLRHPLARVAVVVLVIMGLACIIVGTLWWLPARNEHMKLVEAIDAHRRAVLAVKQAREVVRAEREAAHSVALLETKLRTDANQAQLVQGVARIAGHHGVRVMRQSYEEGASTGAYVPLYLELGLRGSYVGLRDFLADLQGLPMWIEVLDARFSAVHDHAGTVRATIKLLTYRHVTIHAGDRQS